MRILCGTAMSKDNPISTEIAYHVQNQSHIPQWHYRHMFRNLIPSKLYFMIEIKSPKKKRKPQTFTHLKLVPDQQNQPPVTSAWTELWRGPTICSLCLQNEFALHKYIFHSVRSSMASIVWECQADQTLQRSSTSGIHTKGWSEMRADWWEKRKETEPGHHSHQLLLHEWAAVSKLCRQNQHGLSWKFVKISYQPTHESLRYVRVRSKSLSYDFRCLKVCVFFCLFVFFSPPKSVPLNTISVFYSCGIRLAESEPEICCRTIGGV